MSFNTNPGKQSFTATGGQTDFDFNFKIYADEDLKVYLTPDGQDPDDTTDILTLYTDYTVVIDGDDGGTITLLSGATVNDTIVIARDLDATRDISYVTNGDLKAATLNLDQDYQTYLIIDGFVALANAVQLPQSAVDVSTTLPNVRPDSYLKWNSAGTALENDTTIPQAVIDAAESAAAALVSENAAALSEAAASASEVAAALSESNASTSESNAATSESNASTSESNAATSESNALDSENAAALSESNASTSESNASASAAAALASENAAALSESNAATSETNAAAAYDNFDDRYLGEKAADPTLDNDGDALLTGALYFNTTNDVMKVYNGTAWQVAYASVDTSMISKSYYDRSEAFDAANTTYSIPDIFAIVDSSLIGITSADIDIDTSSYWDDISFATAANRAGKDFYTYALSAGGFILSNNSTYPTGYTATNSRKIGGFHCLCEDVGTISGHDLSGYVTGDILPRSVWDLRDKPRSAPEGMVKNLDGVWIDIYLPSWDGTKLVSVYGGTVADGGNGWHTYKFEQNFGMIGKKSIAQIEFVVASLGSNQGTNIFGSSDPGTTGGHSDTASQRMISNIGCEDMCGAYYQWSRDTGGLNGASSWANAYDVNDSDVAGQHYAPPYRAKLGGYWAIAAFCGSRCSSWNASPLALVANSSGRGSAEPVDSQV